MTIHVSLLLLENDVLVRKNLCGPAIEVGLYIYKC